MLFQKPLTTENIGQRFLRHIREFFSDNREFRVGESDREFSHRKQASLSPPRELSSEQLAATALFFPAPLPG